MRRKMRGDGDCKEAKHYETLSAFNSVLEINNYYFIFSN